MALHDCNLDSGDWKCIVWKPVLIMEASYLLDRAGYIQNKSCCRSHFALLLRIPWLDLLNM